MKKPVRVLLLQFIFWILFFNISRIIFLFYHLEILQVEQITVWEFLSVIPHSLKLDVATACYLMIVPFLLMCVQFFYHAAWLHIINKIYSGIMIVGYSLTTAGEMGIYAEWKTKLTYKVIKYLSNPSEIYNSAETAIFFLLLALFLIQVILGIILYIKVFYKGVDLRNTPIPAKVVCIVLTPVVLFIGLRGGVQQIPINQSESYFSKHNILNVAAVNNGFNLYISIFENLSNFGHNPYVFMDSQKADKIMRNLYSTSRDTTVSVLTSQRPNIVLIILESWSADLIQALGGEPGITPVFDDLIKNGLLFDQIYSAGARSEQGMASIFSGFPAHPVSSITVQPDKITRLPSIIRDLNQAGYTTAFYFGGQLIYGNIKSYIFFNQFGKIMEGTDFPENLPQGKLGIHDGFTLEYMLNDIDRMKPPFLTALFTLSTHSPWDQPFEKPLKWGDNEREYINAAYYTDHCLGEFLAGARKKPWYDSTLFVLVADHSHNSYRNWHPHSKEYRRIPLLFYGNVLREEFRGKRWEKLGNQHDLPATLLAQAGLATDEYVYSKNLLNPFSREFAYYSTEDGVGWYSPQGYFTYEKGSNFYYWWSDPDLADSVRQEGFAFLQTVFSDYMSK